MVSCPSLWLPEGVPMTWSDLKDVLTHWPTLAAVALILLLTVLA